MSRNFPSPQQSPRDDADINGSTYALQVALRNMKERYHKLQRKLSFIEEENHRLVHGKTELFGEIEVIQESSIKLREKNLQLNQELHSKHQEICSLREAYNSMSHQNMALTRDNRRLQTQVSQLMEGNQVLQKHLQRAGLLTDALAARCSEVSPPLVCEPCRLSPDSITPLTRTHDSDDDGDHSEDSIDNTPSSHYRKSAAGNAYSSEQHAGTTEAADASARFLAAVAQAAQSGPESRSSNTGGDDLAGDALFAAAAEDASDRMDVIMDEVQRQNMALRDLLPLLMAAIGSSSEEGTGSEGARRSGGSNTSTLSNAQRDRDLNSVTVPVSSRHFRDDGDGSSGGGGRWVVRGAAGEYLPLSPNRTDMAGDNGRYGQELMDHHPLTAVSRLAASASGLTPQSRSRHQQPSSTSCTDAPHPGGGGALLHCHQPDPHLGDMTDDTKICPMCNEVFAKDVTQDYFENHVIAHFEDIDVAYEVV